MTSSGFARVRKMGLALSGTEVSSSWGSPALKVRGTTYAVMASHKSAEPGTLVIVLPIDQRDELIEADPDTYYLKPHYVSYPSVLVRLSRIPDDALRDLLLTAWQLASKSARRRRSRTLSIE